MTQLTWRENNGVGMQALGVPMGAKQELPLIVWSDQFKIGIGFLDKEHRELIDAVNALHDAIEAVAEPSKTSALLRKLADETVAHFRSEETMMAATKYAGLALHSIKHQYLAQQMEAFLTRFNRGGFVLDRHSLLFLTDWISVHIQREDKNFAEWLNEVGKR